MKNSRKDIVNNLINNYSSEFNYKYKETAIILAAGHGKRIKSQTSKMLHKIWGEPTVQRVYDACKNGLSKINSIIVTGIKAEDVIEVIGNKKNNLFAFQEEQNGTGHAAQIALQKIKKDKFSGTVYILPGDMGLINEQTMKMFRREFIKSKSDMMVLTGMYSGDPNKNSYGRIVRVKSHDDSGKPSGKDKGKVIEIIEHKDILSLDDNKPLLRKFNGKVYSFTKDELIKNNEFNSGVFAFKYEYLVKLIKQIKSDNVQGEIYITDLISLFNKNGLSVGAVSAQQQHVIMGFNNKSVLKEMDAIARKINYEKIKDIIAIDDPEDFFISDEVIKEIIKLDKKGKPLDIQIGKGVFVGNGVKLNYNLTLKKNVYVSGNVQFGKNVIVGENVHLSCFPKQKLELKDNVEILWNDIIKGNIVIGENSRIESSVNMTGSDEYPTRIGNNVTIKGTSYVFGSIIDNDLFIEHSVLIKKKVDKLIRKDGNIQPIRFFLPMPEGIDAIEEV
ncbi:MAG: multidrug transporter [Ignavibacteriae bacterium]|nr:MAG: multidrug transporter [Ignavibacteriota bacterium]